MTKITKEELIARWNMRAEIESDIADVYQRHDDAAAGEQHMAVSRAWRQAAAELRDEVKDAELNREGPRSWGGLPCEPSK